MIDYKLLRNFDCLSANYTNYTNYCLILPHFAALDGFAVFKKAALQLSIRVARLCRLLARICVIDNN
jgi:hypothetical protein